jgi:hypothetical protein
MAEAGKTHLTETILVENGKSPLKALAFQQLPLIFATVTSFYDLAIGAPLDLPICHIAPPIQNSYAKNAKSCVYYNREIVHSSMSGSALTRLLKRTPSPLHRMND